MADNGTIPNNSTDVLTFSDGSKSLPLVVIGGIAVGSMLVHLFITFILKQVAKKTGWTFDNEVVKHCALPSFFIFPLISILSTLSFIPYIDVAIMDPIRHALEILLIIFTTWSAIGFIKAASITISNDQDFIKSSNSLQSRKLHTQLIVATRIIYGLIFWIGAATILLTFPRAWDLGVSILASASVGALLIGLAAKPSMDNLIASLQIALTQPLLLDDYVVIDGQQGVVEEIEAQFIVVRTHDERRIIVPLSRVINGTFENWTRTEENIGMSFEFFVDYGIPLEDLKQYYMNNILKKSKYWDHRDGNLNINECRENCLKLKAYMTASNIKFAHKLKEEVCEKLMEYIITTFPEYLPRSRGQTVEKRNGIDSMNRIVTKMEEAKLENNINEKAHFVFQEKE
ncbi:Mechanosensitive ion channel-domain-containing protein [Glomus cerebriforme]|uniref:Mechanosensitive ion channel-domain-containing protein n=1 Tax=Glomus cerebriforme TaxID=658196 RepID=A0A397S2Z6_9GLOM|nr:Mechanosensitive ion channel-domain-containing protein [Glomus cerebriforme]